MPIEIKELIIKAIVGKKKKLKFTGYNAKNDMHLQFDDDQQAITIITPNGNKIVLHEKGTTIEIKDQNNNLTSMDSTGISIESQKDITIKTGSNISIETTADLSLIGASVSIESEGNIKLKGASIKSDADGINEINGSMVKIN